MACDVDDALMSSHEQRGNRQTKREKQEHQEKPKNHGNQGNNRENQETIPTEGALNQREEMQATCILNSEEEDDDDFTDEEDDLLDGLMSINAKEYIPLQFL